MSARRTVQVEPAAGAARVLGTQSSNAPAVIHVSRRSTVARQVADACGDIANSRSTGDHTSTRNSRLPIAVKTAVYTIQAGMTRLSGASANCGCGWTVTCGDACDGSYRNANEPLAAGVGLDPDCQITVYTPGVSSGTSSASDSGSPLERSG